MNKLIEKINYSDGAYWGEPGKFKFKVNIESFDDATEMADSERMIKTTFTFNFRGYLIPEAFNNYINTRRYLSPSRISINDETDLSFSRFYAPDKRAETVTVTGGKFSSGVPSGLGSATDFIRGARSAVGQETQDLEFTNTFGGQTSYVMRFAGEPTSSEDRLAVMTYGFVSSSMMEKTTTFTGAQSSSIYGLDESTPNKQIYQVTVPSGKELRDSAVSVNINGSFLSSNTSQIIATTDYDFYISSSTAGTIAINKVTSSAGNIVGINIDKADDVVIKYVLSIA
jgi:hypothetical protein